MTPEQAIQILDQVTASVALSRQQHQQVMEAIKVLQGLIPQEAAENSVTDLK